MSSRWLIASGVMGAVGIGLGAFGAHALRAVLPLQAMTIYETAIRYHLFHTLALLAVAILLHQHPGRARWLGRAAWLFLAGSVLFSGSLLLLVTTGFSKLAYLTPIGGVAWVAAWLALAWSFRGRAAN